MAVSDEDAAALRELAPEAPVFVISNVHEAVPPTPGFDHRQGLVFVGSFPHLPNVDADPRLPPQRTWPLIKADLPNARLTVVGTEPPPQVHALRGRGRGGHGLGTGGRRATSTRARVSIAPLRYGAGVKGKIGEALGRGPAGRHDVDRRRGA